MRLKSIVFPAIIAVLAIVICIQNYIPGTWLTGWDNLHPEFNMWLHIQRSLVSVWQEYEGLGLLSGMAHAADLPRQLLLLPFTYIVPESMIRYLWLFVMLIIGPLGMYFFLEKIIAKNKLAAFLGGLFYLLNLGTLQTFFTPFETFVSFYGFLPWLLLTICLYLKQGTRKSLFIFAMTLFLATPAFYVQTLFVVFIMTISLFLLEHSLRYKKTGLKRSIKLCIVLFTVSAYWFLPNLYFSISSGNLLQQSKINQLATPDTQYMNEGAGTLENVILLKGFWFDYIDTGRNDNFGYLYQGWREYVDQNNIALLGIAIFVVAISGIVVSLIKLKGEFRIATCLTLLVAIFMLANYYGPSGWLFEILAHNIPLFGQMFRSVFTKWSVVALFSYSIGISLFVMLLGHLPRYLKSVVYPLVSGIILIAIFLPIAPFFDGKLISDQMRIKLPDNYLGVFEYFNAQPKDARIAIFPTHTFWGWDFTNWGYRGSGFWWHGIEQPVLHRSFDVWSRENETFYQQFATAVYQNDREAIKNVLTQYDVNYLLLDKSITIPGGNGELLRFDEIETVLKELSIPLAWNKEFLSVYNLESLHDNNDGFVSAPQTYTLAHYDNTYNRIDKLYETVGNYVEDDSVSYPFSHTSREEIPNITYGDNTIIMSGATNNNNELVIPPLSKNSSFTAAANIRYQGNIVTVDFDPLYTIEQNGKTVVTSDLPTTTVTTGSQYSSVIISIGGARTLVSQNETKKLNNIHIKVGEEVSVAVYNGQAQAINLGNNYLSQTFNTCWTRPGSSPFTKSQAQNGVLTLTVKDAVACASTRLGALGGVQSLLSVTVPYRSHTGSRPYFCVTEENSSICETDDMFYHSNVSTEWSTITRQLELSGNTVYWFVLSGRPSNDSGVSWDIDYQLPTITKNALITTSIVSIDQWEALTKEKRVRFSSLKDFTVHMSSSSIINNIGSGGREMAFNCDIFKRGNVTKEITNTVTYSASNYAASCDFKVLDELQTDTEYVLRLVGENEAGRSLKFYLYNQATNRNDLEVLLDAGKFDQSFSVLPWNSVNAGEYVLNVETRSFGPETSRNSISAIEAYNLPLQWLATWRIQSGPSVKHANDITVENNKKIAPYLYTQAVNAREPGIITLSQGYDNGWSAYSGIPLLSQKLEHLRYNGWANAWKVPAGEYKVTIIYLPQLLQFIGFGLLVGTIVYFGGMLFDRKHKLS